MKNFLILIKTKKYFVGATGFIGSLVIKCEKGYKVVAFDRYNSNNDAGWLKGSKYLNKIDLILGDIRDYDSVYKAMKNCDIVFHLAALIEIPYSYASLPTLKPMLKAHIMF